MTPVTVTANPRQQVSQYKLLGVIINTGLKWDDHVNDIKAKRLWFLKKLKRAGVSGEDLLHFFQAVVRPILEYACQAWHTSLTKEQSKSLKNIQRRVLLIIVGNVWYEVAVTCLTCLRWPNGLSAYVVDHLWRLQRVLFKKIPQSFHRFGRDGVDVVAPLQPCINYYA